MLEIKARITVKMSIIDYVNTESTMKITALLIALLMVSSISCYQIPVGNFIPRALFCDDLDQDGHIDLIVTALNGGIHLLYNNGDGTFQVRDSLPIHKPKSWTNTLFDFNNDGWNDLDGFYRTTDEDGTLLTSLRICISDAGSFDIDNYIDFPAMPELESYWVLYGDWNGDGYPDAFVWSDNVFHYVQNNEGLSFSVTGDSIAGRGWGAFRDIDGDGMDEFLVSTENSIMIYRYPDFTNPFLILPTSSWFRMFEVVDIDHDGDLDIFASICGGSTYSAVCIYENIGNYQYIAHHNVYYDGRNLDIALLKDFTMDGYPDILNYTYVSPYNPANFDYPLSDFFYLPVTPPDCVIYYDYSGFNYVDVDGNGSLDFVLLWFQSGAQIRVYYNDGIGNFSDVSPVSNSDETVPRLWQSIEVYPNPFTDMVNLKISDAESGIVMVNIYNLKGQKIRTYKEDAKPHESVHLQWDGKDATGNKAPKGIYFINVQTNSSTGITKKFIKL